MNKKLIIVLLLGCVSYLYAQKSPSVTGINTFSYDTDNFHFSGIVGESYLGSYTKLGVGGNEYTIGFPYRMVYTEDAFKGELFASKGYYSDYVMLKWEIYDPATVSQIKIYRRTLSSNDDAFRLVATTASTAISWQDEYAEPGQMYKYKILADGVWADEVYGLNVLEGVGFRVTSATVTGRVTFEGGNVVEGVKLKVEPDIPSSDGKYAYHFPAAIFGNHILVRPESNADFSDGLTVQSWIKPQWVEGKVSYPIFSIGTSLSLRINDMDGVRNFAIQMGDQMVMSTPLLDSISEQYMQLSLVWNKAISTTFLYLNGALFFSSTFDNGDVGNANWYIGGSVFNSLVHTFSGEMDEVRLWCKPMIESEVYETYETYVSPNDLDLAAYWKMDEGGGKDFYDVSRLNSNFNENHGLEISQINDYADNFSQEIPSERRLGNNAVTDENGNYVVAGIAYASGGSYYSVVPSKGVHLFDPSDKLLYISKESSVFNNVDFTDVSSFKVKSSVFYAGTNVPVKDVYVKVDGTYVMNSKQQPVMTAADGSFEIDVPIGLHYISVAKNGHEFTSAYWPALDEDGNPDPYDFQDDYPGVDDFADKTRLKLVGKVVGGPLESVKIVGSQTDPSVNNLGQASISFKLESGYELWDNSITYEVFTDSATGVYEANLLPEKFVLASDIKTTGLGQAYTFSALEYKTPIDLRNMFTEQYTIDSVFRDSVIDDEMVQFFDYLDTVLIYNDTRDWIWRSNRDIEVINGNDSTYWGFAQCDFDKADTTITLDCVTKEADGSYSYLLGYPVFKQLEESSLKIIALEEYINADDGTSDKVPVTDGVVEVENNVALSNQHEEIPLDANGEAVHSFWGGNPVVADPYTKNINLKLKVDGQYISGAEISQSCYVLGAKLSSGLNFVTGPDEIDFILRDPPGSDSYAYFEEGFTTSKTITESYSNGFGGDLDLLYMFGTDVIVSTGLGVSVTTKVSADNSIGLSTSHDLNWSTDRTFTESTTYQFSYSTSDDPAYVGGAGDVFFGNGTNIFYGAADNVKVIQESSEYKVGVNKAIIYGKESTTDFVYTANHITNYLIPDLEKLRNELFDSLVYISHLSLDDENYGLSNYNAVFDASSVQETETYINGPSYRFEPDEEDDNGKFTDRVQEYNDKIDHWKRVLAMNELSKMTASDKFDENFDFQNLSFDAGASLEYAITVESETEYTNSYEWSISAGIAAEVGFEVNGFGISVAGNERYNHTGGDEATETEAKEKTIGFVLADGDQGDYFSIDVKKDLFYDAPVFILKGGQSSCPHEAAEETEFLSEDYKLDLLAMVDDYLSDKKEELSWEEKVEIIKDGNGDGEDGMMTFDDLYEDCPNDEIKAITTILKSVDYKAGQEITMGTMKIEVPGIMAENPTVTNVPENSSAVFEIYLTNASDVDADVWYGLFLDAASNPDGAVVKIDGRALVGGMSVLVPAGQTVTKTVTVDKSASEVNDYEDLAIIIHSLCQYDPTDDVVDIADTVLLSAHFIPSCTEIYISSPLDQWVVNTNGVDANGDYKLSVTIEGYDLNHGTFECFVLQYKASAESQWVSIQTFVDGVSGKDTTNIEGKSSVTYQWDMTGLKNQSYDLQVVSVCEQNVWYESTVISGIYDNKPPLLFGSPSPADGVLSADDEIILTFDEDIQAGLLTTQNMSVTGIKNGTDLRDDAFVLHDVSLHFDGVAQHMNISQDVNLKYMPFTFEFWAKRDRIGVKECLISQGDPDNGGLWLGFTADNRMMAIVNGETIYSSSSYTTTAIWNHYAVVFDNTPTIDGNELALVIASGDDDDVLSKIIESSYFGNSPLSVGCCADDLTAFNGNMHSLRLWNEALTSSDIASRRYIILNGYERGLIGAWSMKDASGTLVEDLALSRHGLMNATWSISNKSSAMDCNGGYLEFVTSQLALTSSTDFTLEFWLKSAVPTSEVYLLSNGEADYTTLTDKWAVTARPDGEIVVSNDLVDMPLNGAYLDNDWHHLAISVNRNGSVNIYVDAALDYIQSAESLSGFGSDKCVVGGRYYHENVSDNTVDKLFNGMVDEVRIWNSARSQDHVADLMNYSLRGDEMGLKAYFPFEDVFVINPSKNTQTLANQTIDSIAVAEDATKVAADYTLETPGIKLAKPISDINFAYVVSGSEVLISTTEPDYNIENTTLDISFQGAYDMQGNRMSATASWTAFVNQNQLLWASSQLALECTPDDTPEFSMMIVNKGGTQEYWEIENLPVWLSVDATEGSLAALSSEEVTFTVNPAISVGSYEHDIYLNGSMDYNERCNISLDVKKAAPEWTVNSSDYESSMVLIGQLQVAGEFSTDENDMVAAYLGDECRGVAYVEAIEDRDLYLVNMTIYGDANDADEMYLKVWDASKGNVYSGVTPKVDFVVNDILGTSSNPTLISTSENVAVEMPVDAGWNWLSFNLASSQLDNADDLFKSLTLENGDQVKYLNKYDDYVADLGWGGLMEFDNQKMYKLTASHVGVITLSGVPLTTSAVPVNLANGWNWISYTPQYKMPIESALSYHTPQHEDVIKSQSQFAMYDASMGWIGSLKYMEPFEGYMYHSKSSTASSFKFPQETLFSKSATAGYVANDNAEVFAISGEHNMSMMIQVVKSPFTVNDNTKVWAVSGAEVLGKASVFTVDGTGFYALTIGGDVPSREFNFRLVNEETGETLTASESMTYSADAIIGSVREPFELTFDWEQANVSVEVKPNPFSEMLYITRIPEKVERIVIYDMQGRSIRVWHDLGTSTLDWDGSNSVGQRMPSGAYLLKMYGRGYYTPQVLIKE